MRINPFLAERLPKVPPEVQLSFIVETPPAKLSQTLNALNTLGITPIDMAFNQFILIQAPAWLAEKIAAIENVTLHYNMPKTIYSLFPPIPFLPVSLTQIDPLLGEVRVSPVVIPAAKPFGLPPLQLQQPNIKIIPTSVSKSIVVDVPTTLTGKGVLVAVIDTGAPLPLHPQMLGRNLSMETTIPEPPIDMQGHGSWCTNCALGNPFDTRFGRVEGVATGADILHIKALSTAGFGTSFSVIKAMEIAYNRGAKVVSMSLGGELQGSIFDDPEVKVVEGLSKLGMIFVIAAANNGPDEYTIGSPGAAPSAITVASYSITDAPKVAYWSSRGPQGAWYKDKPDELARAEQVFGEDAYKPDCSAPGGGRAEKDAKPDEVLYAGVNGWWDGFYDMLADGFEAMHGTSQATPHVAGLVALLVEAGVVKTAADIKEVLRLKGHPKTVEDGYGLIRLSMFVGE
jgi:subtilisin family serine protease